MYFLWQLIRECRSGSESDRSFLIHGSQFIYQVTLYIGQVRNHLEHIQNINMVERGGGEGEGKHEIHTERVKQSAIKLQNVLVSHLWSHGAKLVPCAKLPYQVKLTYLQNHDQEQGKKNDFAS